MRLRSAAQGEKENNVSDGNSCGICSSSAGGQSPDLAAQQAMGIWPISGVSVIILVILILFWTGHLATKAARPHFKTMAMVDVPRSRNGKHKKIVTAILRDLDQLGEGVAFKVPLADL
jgi:hypothetical protein